MKVPCYSPLKAFATVDVDGKKQMHFFNEEPSPTFEGEILQIPCGQCLGCRLEYSRQWAVRCCLEAKKWQHNYFVTLTYDEDHVPIRPHLQVDEDSGEVISEEMVMTLLPEDLQKFIKRLRTNFQREYGHVGIRFFACGEYGNKHGRPHYHLILFNCPFADLKLDKAVDGFCYYTSALLEKTWPYGMSLISDFSYQTAAYVARYMLKKHKGVDSDYYEKRGIVPEFARCSRRPGLAREYFDDHRYDMYYWDNIFVPIGNGKVVNSSPPKYFDRLMQDIEPETIALIKEKRKDKAERVQRSRLQATSLGLENYLKVCENNKALSISHLSRKI